MLSPPKVPADALSQLALQLPDEDERVLSSFLSLKDNNVEECLLWYQEVKKWREEIGPVTISDVEASYRSGGPYMITLEYDHHEEGQKKEEGVEEEDDEGGYNHCPIILLNGMIRGSKEEMIKQVVYCVERAWAIMPKYEADDDEDTSASSSSSSSSSTAEGGKTQGDAAAPTAVTEEEEKQMKKKEKKKPFIPRVKFIINTRGGGFRIPDANYRAAVFNIMRFHYPWLINCTVTFVDAPGPIAAGLWAMKAIFDPGMTSRFRLAKSSSGDWTAEDKDLQAYRTHAPASQALHWNTKGKMELDVEPYIQARKKAEEEEEEKEKEG